MLNRRQVMVSITMGMSVAAKNCLTQATETSSRVIDTHLHCFAGPDDPRFPYHPRGPYRPSRPASPELLLERMDGAGVEAAVVVHPEPYQDDHRYLEHCLDVGAGRLKGTCLFFADRPASLRRLPEFLREQGERIVATRLHAYAPDRLPPWSAPELDQLWRITSDANVAMQIHLEPRYARLMDRYVRQYTDTRVIIDHLGRPMQGTPEEYDVVLRWSELPNTIMKIAAIPRQDQYPHRDPAPIVARLAKLWGAERLIYGGGFSAEATNESYRAYRDEIAKMLPELSSSDRAMVFGGNAARIFGWNV